MYELSILKSLVGGASTCVRYVVETGFNLYYQHCLFTLKVTAPVQRYVHAMLIKNDEILMICGDSCVSGVYCGSKSAYSWFDSTFIW